MKLLEMAKQFDKKTWFVAALLGVVVACSTNSTPASTVKVKAEDKRNMAADFTLKDADGKSVKLADYKGKVVLLNFWATWCGPCKVEIPWFVEFEKQFKDQGFEVLGVSMDDEGWEIVKPYLAKSPVNYRMLVGDDVMAQKYGGIESLPTSFVIDRQGRIAATHVGLVERADYEGEIRELLRTTIGSTTASDRTELAAAQR
jgi:cytochrome c biogenesis protein CcmG/thiol:disulfide interchange protein DsbE